MGTWLGRVDQIFPSIKFKEWHKSMVSVGDYCYGGAHSTLKQQVFTSSRIDSNSALSDDSSKNI